MGVREIGLQHDARRHATVRRLVEHAHERLDGQLEVGVLLHVEVDERLRRRRDGGVVDAPQGGADALDGVLERVHVEQGADRRDLHGDVVDVGTLQRGDHSRDALLCLGVGEDRLPEDVEVERGAFTGALGDVAGERGVVGGDDQATGLGEDATAHERHHDAGQHRSDACSGGQQEAVATTDRGWDPGPDEGGEAARRRRRTVDAQHFVGEPLHKVAAGGVGEQATEPVAGGAPLRRVVDAAAARSSSSAIAIARATRAGSSTRPSCPGPEV